MRTLLVVTAALGRRRLGSRFAPLGLVTLGALAALGAAGPLAGCSGSDSAVQEAAKGSLTGKVKIAGVAQLPALSVTVTGPVSKQTLLTSDGLYSFDKLPDATYTVTVEAPSTRERSVTRAVTVSGGAPASAPDIELTGLGKVEGVVTLASGGPAQGAIVLPVGGASFATTDEAGKFTLELPVGSVTLRAVLGTASGAAGQPVEVKYAAVATAPALVLQADGGGGVVTGSASVVGDGDLSGIEASVEGTSIKASTAADGSYTLSGVPTGMHVLHFKKGAFEESVPSVLTLPGSPALVLDDGQLAPLGGVEVQRGRRVVTAIELADTTIGAALGPVAGGAGILTVYRSVGSPGYYVHNATSSRSLGRSVVPAQVAPSGARVVYATETGELRSGPIAGPDVVLDRGVLDPAVVLSPTSASLSYGFSGGARKLSALDGAGKVDLGAYGSSFPAEFSADGSKLLFPSTLGLAKVATVPAGAVTDLASVGGLGQPLLTSNNAAIVGFSSGVAVVTIATSAVTTVPGSAVASSLVRSADRSILVAHGGGKVFVLKGTDGSSIASVDGSFVDVQNGVVRYSTGGVTHAYVVATGKDIAVGAAARVGNAVLFYLSGTDLRRVAFDGTGDALVTDNVANMEISADRSRLLVVKTDGNADTRPTTAGGAAVSLGKVSGFTTISPDGKAVAVVEVPNVRVAATATGALTTAMTRVGGSVAWDGSTLLAVRAGQPTPLRAQNGVYRLTAP